MSRLALFGPGYTGARLADALEAEGWRVARLDRAAMADDAVVAETLATATHILSSVPPEGDADPVLARHAAAIATAPARWVGYLSSTGVYGDTGGAWVDEAAPVGGGRRGARVTADLAWQALRDDVHIFRLPGIYGPGRSPVDRVREGRAHRIDLPEQVFSRVHVDDIVSGVIAAIERGGPGVYNLGDDLPASQNTVVDHACALLGLAPPPLRAIDEAGLSPMAREFYAENRRVANGKAKRLLGWRPLYPTYREGLRALIATTSPTSTNATPAAAMTDQR